MSYGWAALAQALGETSMEIGKSYLLGEMNRHWDAEAAARQFEYATALQDRSYATQYNYNQQSLVDSPSNYRAGLEKAGYNPLLAVSTSNIPTVSGGAGSVSAVRSPNHLKQKDLENEQH